MKTPHDKNVSMTLWSGDGNKFLVSVAVVYIVMGSPCMYMTISAAGYKIK